MNNDEYCLGRSGGPGVAGSNPAVPTILEVEPERLVGPVLIAEADHRLSVTICRRYALDWFKRNLANIVTFLRVALLPLFIVFMVLSKDSTSYRIAAAFVFGVGAATDWFDGQIARRTKTVSKFGVMVDPLADRLFIGGALITLYCLHILPLLFLVIVLGRDILMAAGYPFIRKIDASKVAVHWTGKVATATLFAAIGCLILSIPTGTSWVGFAGFNFGDFGTWETWGLWLFVIGMVWSLVSAGIYVKRVAALLKEEGENGAGEITAPQTSDQLRSGHNG